MHEVDKIVVYVGIIETVFPYEGLEVCTGANRDFMAGRHQCLAQGDIGLYITSCANCRNQNLHADILLANERTEKRNTHRRYRGAYSNDGLRRFIWSGRCPECEQKHPSNNEQTQTAADDIRNRIENIPKIIHLG